MKRKVVANAANPRCGSSRRTPPDDVPREVLELLSYVSITSSQSREMMLEVDMFTPPLCQFLPQCDVQPLRWSVQQVE